MVCREVGVGKGNWEKVVRSVGRILGVCGLREVRGGECFKKKGVINSVKRYLKVK